VKIGIVTTWFERGAAYVSRAYLETLSVKHEVFIYARAVERYAQSDPKWDSRYVTWGKQVPGKIVTYVDWEDFKDWTLNNSLDTVIFNEQNSWEIILQCLTKLNITIGAYIDYYKPDTVPFFWLYDFLLCNTKRHYSVFKDHPQAFYIPWGTDLEAFKPKKGPSRNDIVVFFHSCGLSPLRKGTDRLVRAFRHVNGNAKLIIHSQVSLSKTSPIASLIARDRRIELIESEVGAPGLYHLGDVYVYPTRLEGIGLTVAEALASGLPVITTDAPPMNEFVVHDLNGKLVEVKKYQRRSDNYYWSESICSEAALTKAMQFYVDNIPSLEAYKQRALEYAEVNLDWRKNSHNLPALIENVHPNQERINAKLMNKVARYEQSAYSRPYPYLPSPVVYVLSKAGAGRVKRFLDGLLPSSHMVSTI
jgi:1,2-diacylglycerol 3-alpha-glucosyltransferase